ncbi:MFS transporter [Streptomyces sp. NPDC059373]
MSPALSLKRVTRVFVALSSLDMCAEFLWGATGVLYFRQEGLTAGQVGLVLACFWWSEAVFQVPTGLLADLIGRRPTVILSYLLRAVGYLLLTLPGGFGTAVAAFAVVGLGSTCAAGALNAWAADSAEAAGGSGGLDRLFSLARIGENAGVVAGSIAGALIGGAGLVLPFYGTAVLFLVTAAVAARCMVEPRKPKSGGNARADLVRSVREIASGVTVLLRSGRELRKLMVLGALPQLASSAPGIQWTVYLSTFTGGQLWLLGGTRSVAYLLGIGGAVVVGVAVARWRTRTPVLAAGAVLGAAGLVLAAWVPVAVAAFTGYIVYVASRSIVEPGVMAALNEQIPARTRATALSAYSLLVSLAAGGGFTVLGLLLSDLSLVRTSWTVGGLLLLAGGLPLAWQAGAHQRARALRAGPEPTPSPVTSGAAS